MPSDGALPLRHPPEPEQPDHVVDAHPARVPEHGAHEVAERRVAALLEPLRLPRRLSPVLSQLVERVRGRAHRHPLGVRRPHPPRVGATGVHADGEVVHGAQRHPGLAGARLCGGELLVEQPLQPLLDVDRLLAPGAHRRHRTRGGIAEIGRPGTEVGTMLVREHPPGGEVVERLALGLAVLAERRLPLVAPRHRVQDLQRRALRRPGRVAVDHVAAVERGVDLGRQPVDLGAGRRRQRGVLGHLLDPQVQRVEEPPGRRQVRRRLHRSGRLRGVQRVDQHEVRAELLAGPRGEVGQVGEIAHAPRLP